MTNMRAALSQSKSRYGHFDSFLKVRFKEHKENEELIRTFRLYIYFLQFPIESRKQELKQNTKEI